MPPWTSDVAPVAGHERVVRAEQIKLAYTQTNAAVLVNALATGLFVDIFWPVVEHRVLLTWLGAILSLLLMRRLIIFAFERRRNDDGIERWGQALFVLTFLACAAWGSMWMTFVPEQAPVFVAIATLWSVGLGGAAVVAYSAHGGVILYYVLAVHVPCVVALLGLGGAVNVPMALADCLIMGFLLRAGRMTSENLVETIRMNFALEAEIRERKRAEDRLRELATTDGLTGLCNRRHFDDILQKEIRRAVRGGYPVSLVLADIDGFKAYNDTYGHVQGDGCLQQVGGVLARVANRPGDLAARYGGEELALILPDTDERSAQSIAERLRASVQALELPHAGSGVDGVGCVTVSAGVSTLVPRDGRDQALLLERADGALYEAKRAGRNRVRLRPHQREDLADEPST